MCWEEKFGYTFGETSGCDMRDKRLNFVQDLSFPRLKTYNIRNEMGCPHPREVEQQQDHFSYVETILTRQGLTSCVLCYKSQ